MGEVHAHYIEADFAEGVDLLGRVGLGANGADDGGATVLPSGRVLGIELAEPFNPGPARVEVVETGGVVSGSCRSEGRQAWSKSRRWESRVQRVNLRVRHCCKCYEAQQGCLSVRGHESGGGWACTCDSDCREECAWATCSFQATAAQKICWLLGASTEG